MKISMMTNWNVSCGVSTHAEAVGREWLKMGHQLKVFAPYHTIRTNKDEAYVVRCYDNCENSYFNPTPFIEDDSDIFVVQNLEDKPMQALLKVYPSIRKRAKTVLVIHEGGLPKDENFYKFDFDAVVCFDERYQSEFSKVLRFEKIQIIPYPCYPLTRGDKKQARQTLRLPVNRRIIFNYGLNAHRLILFLPFVERLSAKYPILFLVVTEFKEWLQIFDALKKGRYGFIEWREGPIPIDVLYTYLHASDVLVIDKDNAPGIVVSSTAYLCLGSGCPILVHDTNFFDTLGKEVIKYESAEDFLQKIEDIFNMKQNVVMTLQAAEKYVRENSGWEIGKRFIELFEALRTGIREKTFIRISRSRVKPKLLAEKPQIASAHLASAIARAVDEPKIGPALGIHARGLEAASATIAERSSGGNTKTVPSLEGLKEEET